MNTELVSAIFHYLLHNMTLLDIIVFLESSSNFRSSDMKDTDTLLQTLLVEDSLLSGTRKFSGSFVYQMIWTYMQSHPHSVLEFVNVYRDFSSDAAFLGHVGLVYKAGGFLP